MVCECWLQVFCVALFVDMGWKKCTIDMDTMSSEPELTANILNDDDGVQLSLLEQPTWAIVVVHDEIRHFVFNSICHSKQTQK